MHVGINDIVEADGAHTDSGAVPLTMGLQVCSAPASLQS